MVRFPGVSHLLSAARKRELTGNMSDVTAAQQVGRSRFAVELSLSEARKVIYIQYVLYSTSSWGRGNSRIYVLYDYIERADMTLMNSVGHVHASVKLPRKLSPVVPL